MKKRKFLIPLTVIATSMIADAALANTPDASQLSNANELASENFVENSATNPIAQSDFVLGRSAGVASSAGHSWHESHWSHSSHESHASHSSHYSGY